MYTRKVDVASESYNPEISRVPELIGKHPGVIAPVIIWKPNPFQLVKPASASRVSGMMEVELRIREGNDELARNLKQIVLTIFLHIPLLYQHQEGLFFSKLLLFYS